LSSTLIKILGAITALIAAVSGLLVALRSGGDSVPYTVIHLDSPKAYSDFLENHPAGKNAAE